jgi:hypothetical protein
MDMSLSVDFLNISTRAKTALYHAKVKTIEELVSMSVASLCSIRNLGVGTLRNIQERLAENGLSLRGENPSIVSVEKMAREIYIGSLIRGSTQDCDAHFDGAWTAALRFEQLLIEKRSKNE